MCFHLLLVLVADVMITANADGKWDLESESYVYKETYRQFRSLVTAPGIPLQPKTDGEAKSDS